MNINDEWEKALNGYANIKWNAKQEQPKSPVGDIKKSSERYEPIVGGFINGISSLERLAYQAMGGLDAQLTGWSTNQQTRNTGDIERYRQSYENNPVLQKTALTPEEYEKKRYETPTFWGQVLGGVDQKTKYTEEQAEALRQQRMLEAEKPWMDKANNVEDVRYTRLPSGTLEEIAVDAAVNTPQLGETGLAAAVPYIGPVLSVASMAKNIYGSAYGDTRRKGYSPDAAHGAAAVDTLYQMPFEYTGASRIFKTIPGLRRAVGKLSPEGKSKFAEWLKTVASEGSTEFAQTYGDSSADDIADAIERGDFQKDFEAGAKSAGNIIYKNTLGDKAEENFKESAYAGLLGGVMGGGAHGVGIAMDAVARKLAGNPNPTQEDVVQAIVKAKNDIAQDNDNGGDNPTGGDNSFGNDVLNFLHNQTDVQMTEGQMRNLAAAMAGNAFQESGYDSTAENSIGAYGSFQHLGERRAALEAFAEENGLDPSSRQAQIAFAWKEMMTEGTLENQAFQSIMGLEDNQAKEAAVIYRKLFERPGEEEANDEARVKEAQRVHDSFTQAQQFLKDTAERMDIATEEDAALANELNRLAEEGREEEVLAKARELGFKEQREEELNQQREQIAQQTEEEQNNIPKAPQAAPTPQGQAGQLAPIQTANTQAPQTQQQPTQGMETVNKDRTAPHIDRNKANKGNFNNRGNYNGRLDAPQNKRVESPIRNQGQSAPILQQGENQNAENLQTQTTQRRENRENLNENAQPQQTQTAENQAITQNPQGNEVTPTLAPSNQGTAGIAQNTPKIDSNGQNEITNKVNSEALAKATENDTGEVLGESRAAEQEEQKAKENAILDGDSTVGYFKKIVEEKAQSVQDGEITPEEASNTIEGAKKRTSQRLGQRYANGFLNSFAYEKLENRAKEIEEEALDKVKQKTKEESKSKNPTGTKPNTQNNTREKAEEKKLEAKSKEKPKKKNSEEKKPEEKPEEKPKEEKPQKTKAQQKADAEKDAKAKKLLTKDAYDKVYTPLVNVLEQAQPEVAKAARDTALLMAKTADILHKRFKMKWENAPRVLLGGDSKGGKGIFEQIAWHGSPYTFDAFDLSKIGTGEGAQAHGWGLYFAQDEEVSRAYQRRLGGFKSPTAFLIGGNYYKIVSPAKITKSGSYSMLVNIATGEAVETDTLVYLAAEMLENHPDYAIQAQERMVKEASELVDAAEYGLDKKDISDNERENREKEVARSKEKLNQEKEVLALLKSAKHFEKIETVLEIGDEQITIKEPFGEAPYFVRADGTIIPKGDVFYIFANSAYRHPEGIQELVAELIKDGGSAKSKPLVKALKKGFNVKAVPVKGTNPSRLYKVDIPENDVLLDEQKRYKDQPNIVKKGIVSTLLAMELSNEQKEDFYNKVRNSINASEETNGAWKRFIFTENVISNLNILLRANEVGVAKVEEAKTFLEQIYTKEEINAIAENHAKWKNEKAKWTEKNIETFAEYEQSRANDEAELERECRLIDSVKTDNLLKRLNWTGKDVYQTLKALLGNSKDASLALNKHGIKGITYIGGSDGRCFVVFDDKAVKILETYEQQIKDQVAGSYNAVENLIKVFEKGNASTAVHESAHWYLVTLENLLHAEAEKRGITGTTDEILEQLAEDETMLKDLVSELQKIRNWAQYSEETMKEYEGTELEKEFTKLAEAIKNGDEDAKERFIQERFARGYERYLASGKAPTKELQGVFARFRRWLLDIYNNTIKNLGNKPAPKEIQEIFDRMLEMEETETNTRDTSGEAVKEKSKAKKNYPSGKTVNARTDKADEFPVTYKLIPIEDAITSTNEDFSINENFPQELQPRDRDRSGMKKQVESYASNLSPEEMTIAVKVSEGAPVINQDNIVENGNGRILALLRAYKGGSDAYDESAKRYKAYLREHAADFGFTAEQVDAIERPLLVRQRGSESDNLQRNIVESTSGGMKMSAGQQAKVDAKKISLHTLSLYSYDGSGDLDLASNGRFIKAVLDETISQYDQDSMFTADGSISKDAKARVNNALCALAYGDTDLLDRVSESSDNDYKNYVSAYTIAAPRVAYAKKLMENGDVSKDFDVAKMLNETLAFVLQCKKENVTVSEKLRAGAGLFKGNSSQFEMDGSREFAKFLGNNIRKQRKMADTIKEIADGVYEKAAAGQTSGFFGEDNTTFYDIVRNALGMGNSQFNTNDEMCTLSTKDEAFSILTKNQEKSLTAVAKDYGGTYDESTHTYTFPDEISLEEAREEMDALLDPTRLDFKASAQGKLVEKMRKNAKMLSEDELTDREKGIVAFAEKMGVKLRFFEGDSRLHGFQSDDVIYLNRNSAMNLNQVFWHETFHWLKRNNPKLYEALEKAVLQNDDIAAQVKAWQEKTGRTNLTEEEVIEEMLADAMFDASTRGKFFETLGITHPTLVQKLIKWIKNTYRDLVNQFRHTEGFKPEAGLTNTQINRMSVALDNMALKLVDGNGNKLFSKDAKGNLKENTVKDVRYVDGVKYLVTNKNLRADDVVKVVHLLSGGIDIENENVTQRAKRLTKDLMGKQFKLQNDDITLKADDKDNVNHFIVGRKNTWYQKGKKRVLSKNKNIKRLIENSVYVESRQSYHEDRKNLDYVKFYAVGKVDGRYIRFEIGAYKGHDGTYTVSSVSLYNLRTKGDINPSAIKKGGWNTHHQNGGDFTGGSSSSFIRIADMLEGVKDEDKNLYVINGELQRNDKLVVWTATDSSQLLSEGFKNQDTQQDTPQDTQQDTEKYSVDLSDLENGKVFNNEEQNKKAQAVQKSMELAKDSDTKHFMGKFAGKLFGQKEYDTRKNVAIEGQKDYKQRAKDVSLYGVLTQIISPSRLKDERLKTIYIEGEKAKRTQAKLYSKWTEKHKKILDLVEKAEDYAGYVRALLSEDSERRVFTDDELREMGCSDKVIEAHKQVRALLKEIRDKIAEVYLAKHFEVKNFKTQVEAEAWAANPFFENVDVKPMKKVGGTVWQVKYDTVPYTKTEETVTKWELDKLKEREGRGEIHILESAKVDDTMCTVSYLTPQRTLADLDQYIPHFFHEFLIIERGKGYTKVVGSATTMDEAVEIGNKLAGQKGNEKKQYTITPKGLSFEDGSNSLGIVNKELDELMDGIKDDLSIDLSEAIEAKKQKGKHIFLSALQHRKGAKGWETNLRWVIQHHIGTAARYCALDPYKVKVINYFEKAWGSFADNFTGKDLKAEFAQGLINSVLGVPTRAEKVSDAILELCPLFRNTPQASRVLSSTMLGVMSVLKLGVSPAAAFVNLTQLVNIQGYIGAKWTYEGINRVWKKSKEDMALLDELGTREEAGLETVDVSEATALIAGKYDKQLRQLKKLSDLSMKAFTKAESLLRQAAVLGAYHKALAEGKTEAAARSYALEVNRKANFNYGIEDAPRLFRMLKGSVVGDLFLQFKKYGFKELEVIYDMAFDKSIPKSQKLSFFGEYFLLGGIFNALPFQDTMIELLGLALDSDDPEAEMKEWIMEWAKGSEAKKIVALTAMYGAGSWIGADVSQRVGFRGLTPELEEPFGVTGSTIKQVCTAMLNGDSVGFAKGLSPALGNVVGATKGYNTDSKGRVAYVYKDPLERALRLCGFRTIGEALSVDTQRIVTEARKEKEKERKEAKEAYLENPSYANKQKLKQLGYTDGEIKKFKGNNDSLERTERLKARMTKQELKDFKDVLEW